MILSVSMTFWYLLQKRELRRWYQQQSAEKKELKAVKKEVDITNVLNLQQNAILIISEDGGKDEFENPSVE